MARKVKVDVTAGLWTSSRGADHQRQRNNTNIDRQAEGFYTTNHNNFVLGEHDLWHLNFRWFDNTQGGALFFDFHHEYIARFNRWRAEFGYPAVGIGIRRRRCRRVRKVIMRDRPGTTRRPPRTPSHRGSPSRAALRSGPTMGSRATRHSAMGRDRCSW